MPSFKQKEKSYMQRDEEIYRIISEHSNDGIFLATSYKLVYANPAFLKIFGAKSADELKNKNLLTLLEKEDAEKIRRDIKEALKNNLLGRRKRNFHKFINGKGGIQGKGACIGRS